jgi:hypothetical protein
MGVLAPRARVEQAEKVVSIAVGRARRALRLELDAVSRLENLWIEVSKLHARVAFTRAQVRADLAASEVLA